LSRLGIKQTVGKQAVHSPSRLLLVIPLHLGERDKSWRLVVRWLFYLFVPPVAFRQLQKFFNGAGYVIMGGGVEI